MKGYSKVLQGCKNFFLKTVIIFPLVCLLLPAVAPGVFAVQDNNKVTFEESREFATSYNMTFYPDVDGCVNRDIYPSGESWSSLCSGTGTHAYDSTTWGTAINILANYSATAWGLLSRSIYVFDTSELPDNAVIQCATLSLYGYGKTDIPGITPDMNIYSASPSSDTALVPGDYNIDNFGSTPFSTAITYAGFSTTGYNDFVLNVQGIAAISTTNVSKFGVRNANYDVANVAPSLVDNEYSYLSVYFTEQGAGYQPKLVITYTIENSYTMTFYPSLDGRVGYDIYPSTTTWSTVRDSTGNSANDNGSPTFLVDFETRTDNNYCDMYRSIALFDTSALPDNSVISSATLSVYGYSKTDDGGISPSVNVYSSDPSSNTSLTGPDYNTLGSTAFSTAISFSSFSTTGYNDFVLNSSGRAAITATGISKFGFRESSYDAPNNTPPTLYNKVENLCVYWSEQGAGYQPKLVITYTIPDTTPPAAVNNLAVISATSNSITLTWTSPGDDSNTGTASQYDIRYSTSPLNESNWASAIQVSGEPMPLEAGTSQYYTVTGLSPNTTYYFAIKTADEAFNWSYINCPNGTTGG